MDQTVASQLLATQSPRPQTPVLTATAIRGQFLGLLGELRISQTFVNQEPVDIEAVFTFPVPLEAVLLGLSVRINGRELEGQILACAEAEEEYEDAIASGDKAILLQSAGPGRYTVNVGHLLPGECAQLDYRYALLGVWDRDCLRLLLPTTLAPRYGNPRHAGLAPHQLPGVSLAAEHRFSLALDLGGALASARVASPSHAIETQRDGAHQRISLASGHNEGTAPMDRDLVLLIHAEEAARVPTLVVAPDAMARNAQRDGTPDPDGEQHAVAWLSVQPEPPLIPHNANSAEPAPRDLVLVVDCSGSMSGISMQQTRQALKTIIERLLPSDRINLIAFGSAPDPLFPGLQPVSQTSVQTLQHRLARLQADLGGTELHAALRLAFDQTDHDSNTGRRPLDILLITDGEVWGTEELIRSARCSGHRLFTVGVGAAVAEDLVRGLADASEGACLLVHPNEQMSAAIVRHFERLRAPRINLRLHWPQAPAWSWPDRTSGLFAGDTLHRLAGFSTLPKGELQLTLTQEDGQQQTQSLRLEAAPDFLPADVLPRLAAARRLDSLPEAQAKALALQYQLVSAHTHFVLRDRAGEKAAGLPHLRQVPHMLAAGWGGMGGVDLNVAEGAMACAVACEPSPPPPSPASRIRFGHARSCEMRTSPVTTEDIATQHQSLCDWLLEQQARLADKNQPLPSLDELSAAGKFEMLIDTLKRWVHQGTPEDALVAAVLHCFLRHQSDPGFDLAVAREIKRRLRFLCQRELSPEQLAQIDKLVTDWCDRGSA